MTELSPQQQEALDRIASWYACRGIGIDPFRLTGPAGTGKTTLAREVPAALGLDPRRVQYGAYTGKAASVLRSKGCTPASTLHSLVYVPQANAETYKKLAEARQELAEARQELADIVEDIRSDPHSPVDDPAAITERMTDLEQEIAALEKESHTIGWEWNENSPLASADLLILDEVSMVNRELAEDIARFGIPVLVLGDPEQLEPVGGEGYYTSATPDYALTEIHRQALDSPVLELATRIRLSTGAGLGLTDDDMEPRSLARLMDHDQALCWRNSTRWNIIEKVRAKLDRPASVPVRGDRVMCLTNNRGLGVFNGQQFTVLDGGCGQKRLLLLDDSGAERWIDAFPDGFQGRGQQSWAKAQNMGGRGKVALLTFANAITVHKAQGSEWGSVYVVNEAPDLLSSEARRTGMTAATASARRWLYTAVSRASETVTIGKART